MMRLIKRLGFKNVTEFYQKIADETLDVNDILDKYLEQQRRDNDTHDEIVYRSAEGYNLQATQEEPSSKEDVLVIDQNLKGLEFKLVSRYTGRIVRMPIRCANGSDTGLLKRVGLASQSVRSILLRCA